MRNWIVCFVCLAAGGCGLASSGDDSADRAGARGAGSAKVRLLLNWYPEAEHGGYYAALRQGYYREAGIDLEIVKGGPSAPVVPQVDGGQAEFGIANADGLLVARSQDAKVVALMAPLQTSPRCVIVHASSGIKRLADLKNLTLAVDNAAPYFAFLRKRLPLEGVTVVPYHGSVAEFLSDDNFAQQGYVFSEPFVAERQGGDPKSLLVADLGFNPYTSVLFTSEPYLAKNSETVRKVVAASRRGWEHYLEHPDETNRYIHEINPEMEMEALTYGIKALRPLARAAKGDRAVGAMSAERWRTLADQLRDIGIIEANSVNAEDAFTTEFLRSTPRGQE
jgi:NitT/TauT family transport system substrate-binding protein